MSTKPLTQQQVDYIRAHANDRPRTKVARDAGVSMCTLYRIVREAGGEMRHDLSRRNREHWEIVRRCYPVMTTREIADKYGILYGRVNKIARELGVRHSPEVRERMRAENAERVRASRSKIDFAASAAKRKRKRRYDELKAKGQAVDFDEILENVKQRDYIDQHREVSPLRKADDALLLDNSHLTIEQQKAWLAEQFARVAGQ